jgi:hypothetical protein
MRSYPITDTEYKTLLDFFNKYSMPYVSHKNSTYDYLVEICYKFKAELLSGILPKRWDSFIEVAIEIFDEYFILISNAINKKDINQVKETIKKHIYENRFVVFTLPKSLCLYRYRPNVNSNEKIEKSTLHIPFSCADKAQNMRYSKKNTPMLYLSTSMYNCWEECRRKGDNNGYFSLYYLNEPLNVIGIEEILPDSFKLMDRKSIDACLVSRIISFFPLAIIMFMKVTDKALDEYCFSQLFMDALIESKYADGIIYSSTQKNNKKTNNNICKNVVFICHNDGISEYDSNLLNKFKITKPIQEKDVTIPRKFRFSSNFKGCKIKCDGIECNYEDSIFAFYEDEMKCRKVNNEIIELN